MAMSDRIKERRIAIGLSQEELSKKLGVSKGAVGNYETGVSNPKIEVLLKMFDILKTDANYLLQDEIKNIEYKISADERKMLDKYRKLDLHGKTMVDFTVDEEYNRCTAPKEDTSKCETIELPFSQLKASAGLGDYLFDENFETIEVARTYESEQATFAIEVDGDSMEPEFSNGDIVLVKGTQCVEVGDIGIFIIDGEGYIKECGENELVSLNPDYPNIKPSEFADFRTVGKVLGKVE